jgi:predicted small lipoprotein YifL
MPRTLTLLLAAALLIPLSACGRKAALEAPNAIPPAEGEKAPPAEPKEDKPFILDGLIQ